MSNQDNEWRTNANEVAREGAWTVRRFIPLLLLLLIIAAGLSWLWKGGSIVGMDIEREVVQHSRPYIEARVSKLHNLYSEYLKAQTTVAKADAAGSTKVSEAATAQQKGLLLQMRKEAGSIPSHEVPDNIQQLIKG